MCQALDALDTRAYSTRLLNWQISLYAVLLNIIVLIPLSLCLVSTISWNSSSAVLSHRHLLAILAPLFLYFLLLSYVPLPDGLVSSGMSDTFTLVTARYNVLGTFILGCLSGFGSCRNISTRAELDQKEQSLTLVRADIVNKRNDLTSLKAREASQSEAQKSSWLSRVTPNFRGDDELSNTEAELSALISLEENMASELRLLHQRYAESTFDRTWRGRLFVLIRHATGFYCIFRALISLSNILLPAPTPTTLTDSPQSPDLIASTLVLLIPHPSPATEANLIYATRQMNLVLVGVVIIASIRRVLQGAARALRATPASRNRVASLVLLLHTSFPPAADGADAGLFAMLPAYETFGLVFDWSFLASAAFAAAIEWTSAPSSLHTLTLTLTPMDYFVSLFPFLSAETESEQPVSSVPVDADGGSNGSCVVA
ncbi:hypothetical protein F5888DRAFT_1634124 [Russula emetica]|nr:hypothetical protein F5888DRAFT_1634124 [Russula emetica]